MKVRVFTDGACSGNPGPGGWAAIILLDEGSQQISGFELNTTNNRMELKAVVEAIKVVKSIGQSTVDIYSDSAYVVNAIDQNWIKRWARNGWQTNSQTEVKNKDLWEELLKLIDRKHDRFKVNVIKVKGHSGNKNNERADVLAKKEIESYKRWANEA